MQKYWYIWSGEASQRDIEILFEPIDHAIRYADYSHVAFKMVGIATVNLLSAQKKTRQTIRKQREYRIHQYKAGHNLTTEARPI